MSWKCDLIPRHSYLTQGVVRDRATATTITGEETSQKADNAKSKVKVILDDLPKKLEMTVPLAEDSANTKKDITTNRSQGLGIRIRDGN